MGRRHFGFERLALNVIRLAFAGWLLALDGMAAAFRILHG